MCQQLCWHKEGLRLPEHTQQIYYHWRIEATTLVMYNLQVLLLFGYPFVRGGSDIYKATPK